MTLPPLKQTLSRPDIPATRLPFFDTTAKVQGVSEACDCGSSKEDDAQFKTSTQRLKIVQGERKILERFALFVSTITDSENVAFVACTKSGEKSTVQATIPSQERSLSSETQIDLSLIDEECADESIDFVLEILPRWGQGENRAFYNKPFVLSLLATEVEDFFDICLSYGNSHGLKVAAVHLFQLVLIYLRPRETANGCASFDACQPGLSVLNFPRTASAPLQLPWDNPSNSQAPPLLHTAFERRAAEFPSNTAIEYLYSSQEGQFPYSRAFLTYHEVSVRVAELAEVLEKIIRSFNWPAVRGEQRIIPMLISSCPELYICCLAIMKAGHAFCSLPVDAPQERLKEILEDLGAPVVLGVGSERFRTPGHTIGAVGHEKLGEVVWLDTRNVKRWPEEEFASSSNIASATCLSQRHQLSGDDLAYVFYTSGSTGKPKGVQISHLAATCSVSSHAEMMPILSQESPLRWFQLIAPTFDPFILEVFLTLSAGGTLCAAEREITLTNVEDAINELEANTTHSVPSLAIMFRPERMPNLKTLLCAGEMLNRRVIETFSFDSEHMSKHKTDSGYPEGLTNLYGPTECTVNVSIERFTSKTRGSIIGKVLPTCSVILLDFQSDPPQPVPIGVPGHLAVGGPQVSHGYLNRPEENARHFISHPNFGRLYLTGDKARIVWNEKGEQRLEYLGRIQDTQVKLNGRRVELEEIDAVIAKAVCVSEVATVALEVLGGTQLIACVALLSDSSESEPELVSSERRAEDACRKNAETYLPRWMYPHHFVFLPRLPRTISGKLDRKSIRETAKEKLFHRAVSGCKNTSQIPEDKPIDYTLEKVFPGAIEGELCGLLCDVLKKVLVHNSQDITWSTSLFALGLDSLGAIAFLQEARDQNIHELGIQDMLKGLTPEELSQIILDRRQLHKEEITLPIDHVQSESVSGECNGANSSPNLRLKAVLSGFDHRCRSLCADQLGIPSENIQSVYPATALQTTMIVNFLDSNETSDPSDQRPWIEHFIYNVPDSLDSYRFEKAFSKAISRHDCFRTVFTVVEDLVAPCAQCVLFSSCTEAKIPWSNISCDSADTEKSSLFQKSVENAQRTAEKQIRLERPPISVSFIRSSHGSQCALILSLFHGIFDAVSLQLLRKEVMAEYYNQPQPSRTSLAKTVELHFSVDPNAIHKFWYTRMTLPYGPPKFRSTGQPNLPSHSNHNPAIKIKPKTNGAAAKSLGNPTTMSAVSVVNVRSKVFYSDLTKSSMHELLTTPLSIVQAAWALVLLECQQIKDESTPVDKFISYDVTFGSTLHGRFDPESQICMGPVFTTIPMRVAGDTASETTKTNREMCHIFAHQHAEALEHLQVPCPSLKFVKSFKLFDSILTLQNFGGESNNEINSVINGIKESDDFPGYEDGENRLESYRGAYCLMPINIEVIPGYRGRTMQLQCTFQNSSPEYPWLSDASARHLLDLFEENLMWIMANPDASFDPEKRRRSTLCSISN